MKGPFLEDIRVPNEIRRALREISKKIVKHGQVENDGIVIGAPLTERQNLAKSLFFIVSEVDEVLANLNIVLSDIDKLIENPKAFGPGSPFLRYKAILRFYFYEFSRFEDIFGHLLFWLEKQRILSKNGRKELRSDFYEQIEPMVRIRNRMLHDSFSWEGHITHDIVLLESADSFKKKVVDLKTGDTLKWEDVLTPMCNKVRPELYSVASDIRIFWNMTVANITYVFRKHQKI